MLGKKGGEATAKTHDHAFYVANGKKNAKHHKAKYGEDYYKLIRKGIKPKVVDKSE
jgi:hypothetical protein